MCSVSKALVSINPTAKAAIMPLAARKLYPILILLQFVSTHAHINMYVCVYKRNRNVLLIRKEIL